MRFTIYKDSWLRGNLGCASYLHRADDDMECCLGQICIQRGASEQDMRGMKTPEGVAKQVPSSVRKLLVFRGLNTAFTKSAMDINDTPDTDDFTRMKRLRALFSAKGHTLRFVSGKAPWLINN